ncbi:MAG: hypothetical protein GKR85_09690 [Candidatus Nanopelagicales bacterium]|nr:hypothetical protein [Candidatus Nanopelagicales bacterium]
MAQRLRLECSLDSWPGCHRFISDPHHKGTTEDLGRVRIHAGELEHSFACSINPLGHQLVPCVRLLYGRFPIDGIDTNHTAAHDTNRVVHAGIGVVCQERVDGDGGFAMNVQELSTLMHQQLPHAIFILDNGGYGYPSRQLPKTTLAGA